MTEGGDKPVKKKVRAAWSDHDVTASQQEGNNDELGRLCVETVETGERRAENDRSTEGRGQHSWKPGGAE
eukprot:Skav212373  [mRNA]  locus=scaffold1983:80173:80706:+ [translate_table: standard]